MQLFYTVRPGDSIFAIAARWKIPLPSLIAANRLTAPYTIYPGQQLSMPPGMETYRVQTGDSVYRIAQMYGVPPALIIEANRLQPPYAIEVGQILRVPPGVPYYTVQSGDSLFRIAAAYNVATDGVANPELIRQANRLPSDTITPGMRLVIPYAPPGGGGVIAYNTNRGGRFDLWLYDPRSGAEVRITEGLGESYTIPYWSPDSSKIAFIGNNGVVFVHRPAAGHTAQIDQIEPFTYIGWSPDSQSIAYVKNDRIVIYDLAAHQAVQIDQPGASDVQWFPSGSELLFQAPDEAGNSQVFRMRTDGTGRQAVTQHFGVPHHNVRLSPDGTYFLYTSPGVSISIIHTHDLLTGNIYGLEGGPLSKNYNPAWSPDSGKVAYSATVYDNGYYSLIQTDSRQGGQILTWAISNCFSTPVSWSPEGHKIAYLSGCADSGEAREMWAVDVTNPVPVKLTEGAVIGSLQWSPSAQAALPWTTYSNTQYRVSFVYPANWQKVTDERYEGKDGFFQISAIAGSQNINDICRAEALHPLKPYGTSPRIMRTTQQGQEACFIYPSADQPPEMRDQAAFIVKYPQPVMIGDNRYNYFILWADKAHIYAIARSLTFIS